MKSGFLTIDGDARYETKRRVDLGDVFGFDKPLAIAVIALSIVGILFIYSASKYSASVQFGDEYHYVKTQAIALFVGLLAMFGLSFFDADGLKKFAFPLYVVGIVLLSLVFLPVVGVESYGAKRWLNLGFFTIQPSEYAKFFMVMLVAKFMSTRDMAKFKNVLVVLLIGGVVGALLILEPNMSITMCVVAALFAMLFFGGIKGRHFLIILIPVVVGAVLLVLLEPYRMKRLLAFLDPWESPLDEGYQLIQSYYALGSGGLFGVGIGNSRQKYLFLPFAESDFILSVIGEETGLFGVFVVMLAFLFVAYRGLKIAKYARSRFSCYLAYGIVAITTAQALINFAVVCGAIPPTGLPLPFMSAGGSSLVAYLSATGILLSISKNQVKYLRTDTLYFARNNPKNHTMITKKTLRS
ncbi:MAG: putative lipid II flippase FtsW [Clostridia bacterium]|nr:putative lipid II flippase FtsW [Clostridia bacterium]